MAGFTICTELGDIAMKFRPDAAPESVAYYTELIKSQLFDGVTFYRSDFVIQMGTHGTSKKAPRDLHVNETHKAPKVSNTRGTAAIAHWDVPDCGNSEFFINLKSNGHLDDAYGATASSPRWPTTRPLRSSTKVRPRSRASGRPSPSDRLA